MDFKRRSSSSFDDPSLTASALRRLTHTPRLGLRRPGTPSSIASHDHEEPVSCVTRDGTHDECALNRFLVWAAVKRNTCEKMTPEEKRECPLLRCRKRFPNHELMLRHLYACDELAAGEYWCYDCEKVERFVDAKCKRCLGHPSKRTKIKTLAKSFFSSVGHRSKTGSLPDLCLDVDDASSSDHDCLEDDDIEDETPCLDGQIELQANEIHEIDSYELPLPTIIEEAPEVVQPVRLQMPQPIPPRYRLSAPLSTVQPAELESVSWKPSPEIDTVSPVDLSIIPNRQQQAAESSRPPAQGQPSDFAQYRAQAKRRSKMLAPSSSVRSNKSIDTVDTIDTIDSISSTNSKESTTSTVSYAASTVSSLSEGWATGANLDCTLSSSAGQSFPTDHFDVSPQSVGGFSSLMEMTTGFETFEGQAGVNHLDSGFMASLASELPADVPMVDAGPSSVPMAPSMGASMGSSMGSFQDPFPFASPTMSTLPLDTELSMNEPPLPAELLGANAVANSDNTKASAHHLITTAWEALQMHIKESMERLRYVNDNHLVDELRSITPEAVASRGFQALSSILERTMIDSPVDLLCFVHLVYSFSLVVHEQDAQMRGSKLFKQAVSYGAWFSKRDRHAYLPIVDVLWKPRNMAESEVVNLIRSTSVTIKSRGKAPRPVPEPSNDALAFVAQFFLDELEYLAVQEKDYTGIQASTLCIRHMKDATIDLTRDSQADMSINFVQNMLSQQFAQAPALVTSLGQLRGQISSSNGSTARRLELELMHIGKMKLSSDTFFDAYIPSVRKQTEALYTLTPTHSNTRLHYHRLGIQLALSVMTGSSDTSMGTTTSTSVPGCNPAFDLFLPNSPALDEFSFDTDTTALLDCTPYDGYASTLPDPSTNSSFPVTPITPDSGQGASTAVTSPNSHESTGTPQANAKTESDSCCELCGYRPEGDPRWFPGSMAKHKKLQHATSPPKIYQCPYPGCSSKYTNRPDNLRQHQLKKGHFVDGEEPEKPRVKRKKMS